MALAELSSALALRLRDLARLADRLDRLESGTGEWLSAQSEADWRAASTDIVLRALRTAADPANFAILTFLSAHSSAPMAELEQAVGLGRLALSERVNDLIQVGLAARHIDTDHAQGTAAGAALVNLINSIGETTAEKISNFKPQTSNFKFPILKFELP
ncbi:MAG: hypothetical protein FJ030_17685 [Chloroflexi bacterium]|nr:hypothetical protein [Chloroflexota bacterium]